MGAEAAPSRSTHATVVVRKKRTSKQLQGTTLRLALLDLRFAQTPADDNLY
jgi:hypothetical protein